MPARICSVIWMATALAVAIQITEQIRAGMARK